MIFVRSIGWSSNEGAPAPAVKAERLHALPAARSYARTATPSCAGWRAAGALCPTAMVIHPLPNLDSTPRTQFLLLARLAACGSSSFARGCGSSNHAAALGCAGVQVRRRHKAGKATKAEMQALLATEPRRTASQLERVPCAGTCTNRIAESKRLCSMSE